MSVHGIYNDICVEQQQRVKMILTHKTIKSNTLHQQNGKLYQHGPTRRKSCYCTECGSQSKFQFENMNVAQRKKPLKKQMSFINRKSTFSLTIPRQEFRRKSGGRATEKKRTITEAATTAENGDDQKTFTFLQPSFRSSILSNIKKESQKMKLIKLCKPLKVQPKKILPTNPVSCKHIKLLAQTSTSRIKTENFSLHKSPQERSASKLNYFNSPYFYTYRSLVQQRKDKINCKTSNL